MLPTSFANFASERPELKDSLAAIERWCKEHVNLSVIDPRRLAVYAASVSEVDLSNALMFLVDKGVLSQVYRFQTEQGYFLSEDYPNLLDVPEALVDRDEQRVWRHEGEIVPVFRGLM